MKNDIVQLTIDNLGCNGEGVARQDGKAVFVPGALIGEKVLVKIIADKRNYSVAKLMEVIESSNERRTPICRHFIACGGCNYGHVNYADQLMYKRKTVRETLKKICGVDYEVNETVQSVPDLRYRNKLSLPVRMDKGQLRIGMYAENTHRIVEIDDCSLQPREMFVPVHILRDFIERNNIDAYDESTRHGSVRHIVVRRLNGHNYIVVVSCHMIDLQPYVRTLDMSGESYSLWLNINSNAGNVILGDRYVFVGGEKDRCEVIDGITITVHPAGFFQVNDYIRRKMYNKIADLIDGETVIDAYSGAGLMSAMIARRAKHVYGVEINSQASESARRLAQTNGIENMTAICGDCAEKLPLLESELSGDVCVVLDPPRTGCDGRVLDSVMRICPKRIVYVSCNPATLARDLVRLTCEYEIRDITPYDMFPYTKHVETLVVLHKKC